MPKDQPVSPETVFLRDVAEDVVKPLNKVETKAVLAVLKELGRDTPEIAALLSDETPLKSFIIAALTLSPYLRETAALRPDLLARALHAPLEESLNGLVEHARHAWRPEQGGVPPTEAMVMSRLRQAKRGLSFCWRWPIWADCFIPARRRYGCRGWRMPQSPAPSTIFCWRAMRRASCGLPTAMRHRKTAA